MLAMGSVYCISAQDFKPYEQKVPNTSINFKMVPIPEGKFMMGSEDKDARPDEKPVHEVSISPFWMGAYEVTHDEFLQFFNDESVSRNSDADAVTRPTAQYIDLSWGMGKAGGFPFNSMSQHTALMYCKWLYKKTGVFYRLPTEAEWEYACRAGTKTAYFFGEDASQLKDFAWYAENSNKKYQKVGQKKPNPWGLYDIIGNVAEWTLDQYEEGYYAKNESVDPVNTPVKKYPRVVRGGGYTDPAMMLRSAARSHSEPSWNKRDPQVPKSKWWLTDGMSVGFRVVRPVKQPTEEEAMAYYEKFASK
jgi:formylglycine-generating enzyme required for sulfatase activity